MRYIARKLFETLVYLNNTHTNKNPDLDRFLLSNLRLKLSRVRGRGVATTHNHEACPGGGYPGRGRVPRRAQGAGTQAYPGGGYLGVPRGRVPRCTQGGDGYLGVPRKGAGT